jgi:hypothetical protein
MAVTAVAARLSTLRTCDFFERRVRLGARFPEAEDREAGNE